MPSEGSAKDSLTVGQRRHLTASLGQVENALRRIITITSGTPIDPVLLSHPVDDLPAGFGDSIGGPLADAAATLAQLVATFGLKAPADSRFRSVQALVVSSVVIVEDTVSRHLSGYGEVHPDLKHQLDPLLEHLHETLLNIGRALPRPTITEETPT
jgi:hypothetical protein